MLQVFLGSTPQEENIDHPSVLGNTYTIEVNIIS